MATTTRNGRHRSLGYNPVSELSTLVKNAGESGIKASAIVAASGGLVAAFAVPAQAQADSQVVAAQGAQASVDSLSAASLAGAAPTALTAPAVVAPNAVVPTVDSIGIGGIKAVKAPKVVVAAPETSDGARVAADEAGSNNGSNGASGNNSGTKKQPPAVNRGASTSAAVNIARKYLGIYYVWGGTTPAGFDCSGFTGYVYRQLGISLPRTAAQQQAATTRVSNPQPGDMVFWGYPAYHNGIYAGNGMVIDSARAGFPVRERAIWGSPTYHRVR